jgi:hypothetical protein
MELQAVSTDYVNLRFSPRWTYIGCVRRFVAGFFMIGLADKERAEQISMAASELLENAVKYASEEETSLQISIANAPGEVDVCVTNAADADQVNVLRREFALVTAGDPEKVYLRRMEEAAKADGLSRLGLVRIRYETGARLRLEAAENRVSMHAVFSLESR